MTGASTEIPRRPCRRVRSTQRSPRGWRSPTGPQQGDTHTCFEGHRRGDDPCQHDRARVAGLWRYRGGDRSAWATVHE